MRLLIVSLIRAYLALLLIVLLARSSQPETAQASMPAGVWGSKPLLAHLLLNPADIKTLQQELGLSKRQIEVIQQVARQETMQVQQLEADSLTIIANPALDRLQKTEAIARSGYNWRLGDILQGNQKLLQDILGEVDYQRLVQWVERRWAAENQAQASRNAKSYPRSFEVYATRYDAGDRKIVALPDKCLKFANGGALQCDGYAFGSSYSVAITYEGKTVYALVGEAGPWNVDDNYWSKSSDPQPRRMFADLPLGVPEAQAAYFNGYNGGVDQYGRVVTSPVGIDISRALAEELGLPSGNNKVIVSFLWTEGWDKPKADITSGAPAPTSVAAITWITSTPGSDGSIIHIVQPGQTLVGIATVYNIPLQDLLQRNNMTMQSVIQPGDKILVKTADATPTPTATITATMEATRPAPTASITLSATPSLQPSPGELLLSADSTGSANARHGSQDQPTSLLTVILVVGCAGIVLLIWGVLIQRRH